MNGHPSAAHDYPNYDKQAADILALVRNASSIEAREVQWVIPHWLPRSVLSIVCGHAGAGKSTALLAILARLSRGEGFAGQPVDGTKRILMICSEDDPEFFHAPQFKNHDASLDMIDFVTEVFDPSRDLQKLAEFGSKYNQPYDVIAIDPLLDLAGTKANPNDAISVRAMLKPAQTLARTTNAAVIGIAHFRKPVGSSGDNADPLHRLAGSGAFGQVARSVLTVVPSPDTDDGTRRLVRSKSQYAPPGGCVEFRIATQPGHPFKTAIAIFNDTVIDGSATALIDGKRESKTDQAMTDICELLDHAGKWVSRKQIVSHLEEAEHGRRTVDRALAKLVQDDVIMKGSTANKLYGCFCLKSYAPLAGFAKWKP
ncbi:MAG: AAA family ATPase [Proteobacteria bacterium]|nr:AAA family ATPase [Pseudomonadota bacterium]